MTLPTSCATDPLYSVTVVAVGTLDISSTPSGAAITIDGNASDSVTGGYGAYGVTPKVITGLSYGSHTIGLTYTGYQPFTSVEDISTTTTTKSYIMTALTGSLNISSTPEVNALIYIDGTLQGTTTTPVTLTGLTPGNHTYQLTKSGYTNTVVTGFSITAGQTTTVSPAMLTIADIRALNMIIHPDDPCIQGSCVVTVTVSWRNYGGTLGTFTPSIDVSPPGTINGVSGDPAHISQNLAGLTTSDDKVFKVRGLTAGTHSICPTLNT